VETTALQLLAVGFSCLSREEQRQALEQLSQLAWEQQQDEEDTLSRLLRSFQRVCELEGSVPTAARYRLRWRERREAGEELASADQLIEFFGSWNKARQALTLSTERTTRDIENRFRRRRLGAVRQYSEAQLREALFSCVEIVGGPPLVAEFEWWRRRELELAHARGEHFINLPSPAPYRRRWGSWEGALRHFGFTEAEIDDRYAR
jgi:hypothetical protein